MPLISEALRAEDGVLLDSSGAGADWVESGDLSTDAPKMIAAINILLDSFNVDYPEAALSLEVDSDRARVVGAQDYDSANAAQQTIRDIVTSLCTDLLRESDLVAFAYSEASLEHKHTRVIWDLVNDLPTLLGMSTGTTLLLSCEGQLHVDIHCSGDPSLLARIANDGIGWRNVWRKSALPLRTISRHDESSMPLFVLFLGAGASVGFGLPSGDKLRNEVLSRLMEQPVDESTFNIVAHEWWADLAASGQLSPIEIAVGEESFVDTLTLETVLEHEQQEESQRFSSSLVGFAKMHDRIIAAITENRVGDDPLRSLVSLKRRLLLITVNFDQVIEARCEAGDVQAFATEEELKAFPAALDTYLENGGPVPLLKLHGDITKPETIVANISRTSAGLNEARSTAIRSVVVRMEESSVRPWWYVGYSMRDRDLDTVWKDPVFYKFHERWVSPFIDPNVMAFVQASRLQGWKDRQLNVDDYTDRFITWTADDFFRQLYAAVGPKWKESGHRQNVSPSDVPTAS